MSLQLDQSKVAVTGATGFIGRYIVRSLLERGAHVVAVVRNPDRVPAFREQGVELRKADLADEDALTRGFEGVDAVISNAGVISLSGMSRDELIEANLVGTRNVFNAIARAGVKRAVHTSSTTVYKSKRGVYHEDDPLRGAEDPDFPLSRYGVSKACGEKEAWRLADEHGITLSTVRPHSVHGAFDEKSFTKTFKRLMAPPISVYPTHMRFPSVYAGDIGEAMCRMLEVGDVAHKAYNITGAPGAFTYWDLMRAWKEAGGKVPKLILPVPVPITVRYDISRATNDLGWKNRPLVDGLRDMLELERAG